MLLARYLSVFSCGIEALMAQVFLKKPQAIPRIVLLHRVDGEGIPEAVRADIMYFARLGVGQLWQTSPQGTFLDNLPGPVAIDAEDELIATPLHWTATTDVIPEHIEGIIVDRQSSHSTVLQLLCK